MPSATIFLAFTQSSVMGTTLAIWRWGTVKSRMKEQMMQIWGCAHSKLCKNRGIICLESRLQGGK